ncbi:hypothetical protein F511_22444 [Dorcoceras hygrometricum]|uniref:Uncharacterized protein n=1 Tax=Dorcoceras hygrometricum TaxID=472368 RepID=A0A2Z7AZH9_9LAMI|nr:hypothetical protein F511_22444 [Dorcoceras hygrometricum]
MLTQKLTLAEERTHRLFSKASKSSSFAFPLPAQYNRLKMVANERAKQGESSATKISKNRGWMRRETAVEIHGEQCWESTVTVYADDSRADATIDSFISEPDEEMEPVVEEQSADEAMSLGDIIYSIPVDVQLPSASVEITKITMGKEIKIPGVDERTWYLASLPQISVEEKGKELLVEKDPVKGNPVKEQISLILADIECLVTLRKKVIDEARRINFAPGDGSSVVDLEILHRLSDIHSVALTALKEQAIAHGITWKQTCCSEIFEGQPRHRGAVISRSNTNTPSTCWIRTMRFVDGVWAVQPCADHWIIQTSGSVSSSVQCSFVSAVSPNVQLAVSPIFALEDNQMDIDHRTDSPIRFTSDDIPLDATVANQSSLPTVFTSFSASIDDLQIFLSAHIDESQSDILSKLHTIETGLRDSLRQQEEAFRTLIQGARQGRTIDDVQTLRFNEFRKSVLANSVSVTIDLMDIKKAMRELNAKVDVVSTRLDDVRKYVEATKEAISHQLLDFQAQAQANYNILTGQLSELVDYTNRGGNDKKGEGSSRGPQPPPDDQNRGSGNTGVVVIMLEPQELWRDLLMLIDKEKEKGA